MEFLKFLGALLPLSAIPAISVFVLILFQLGLAVFFLYWMYLLAIDCYIKRCEAIERGCKTKLIVAATEKFQTITKK